MLLYAIFFALYEKAMCNIPPCAPLGAQGVDTAYGSSYKGQTIRQQTGSLRGFLSD